MKNKPIIIVLGQFKSIIYEILFKSLKSYKLKSPLLIITSKKEFIKQMQKFNFKKKVKYIDYNKLTKNSKFREKINLTDSTYKDKPVIKLNKNSEKEYINKSFTMAIKLINIGVSHKFLNGPINKSFFLNKKYLGITEYLSDKFKKKRTVMLIYNKKLSVCPLTTHLPIRLVSKNISKKKILDKIKIINDFYIKNFKIKPKIGVTGLNPHCESILKNSEDDMIISPAIKIAKKNGINVNGPYSADTIFLRQNRRKYNVILGMYHDQVLTPLKTLYEYDAINITLGLPFLRVSPDHGPNEKMINKNLSNPTSFYKALEFLDKN